MKEIINEIRNYSKKNCWVFIIFFISLFFIFYTNKWNVIEVFFVFLFHFIWDLFILIMWSYYNKGELKKWWIYQLIWIFIITIVWVYSAIFNGKWNYVFWQIWFFFAWAKSYFINIKWKSIKFLNWKTQSFILIFMWLLYFYFWFITSFWIFIQFLGLLIFPLWLILDKDYPRYFVSLLWIFLMTLWSFMILYEANLLWNINGVDISFSLLPMTVLIAYLKSLRKYLHYSS